MPSSVSTSRQFAAVRPLVCWGSGDGTGAAFRAELCGDAESRATFGAKLRTAMTAGRSQLNRPLTHDGRRGCGFGHLLHQHRPVLGNPGGPSSPEVYANPDTNISVRVHRLLSGRHDITSPDGRHLRGFQRRPCSDRGLSRDNTELAREAGAGDAMRERNVITYSALAAEKS
jgi:hypothetical protein